jgi:long-chain acyl-CoA synthetase
MSSNLALNLAGTATARGQSQALRLADVVVSYAGLNEATARFAGLLRERGVGLGDRVGIMLPNVPYFAVAYYGVLRAGGAVVPMSVLLKQREVAFYLGDPEAKLVFAWHEFAEPAQAGAAQADAECVIVAPGEFEQLLATIDPVTVFEGVPTMYSALLHHPERDKFDVSSLNVCASGGAALPVEVLRGFEKAFGCKVLEGYGLSETSPVASFNPPDRERRPGSIGIPVQGVEMRVVDEQRNPVAQGEVGEIAIRGENLMKGYWNRPEATAEAIDEQGWFYTGDMAKVDEEGYYFIVDRKKDMIIRGGYNVYPREVEEVLYEHPAVREAAVIGVAHDSLGEEVAAAVALKPDAEITAAELRDYCRSEIAAYEYPRRVWIVDELPKGPTGKILMREIEVPAEVAESGGS